MVIFLGWTSGFFGMVNVSTPSFRCSARFATDIKVRYTAILEIKFLLSDPLASLMIDLSARLRVLGQYRPTQFHPGAGGSKHALREDSETG